MAASDVSAEDIAARLSALGLTPRVEQYARHTSIESDMPESIPAETWREALEAVAGADRFGLVANKNGRALWAAVHTKAPATNDVQGPGRQR